MKPKLIFLFLAIMVGWALPAAKAEDRSVTVKPKKGIETTAAEDAKYFAIVIGNQNYKHLPKLKTPVADAKAVENILKTQYGFETKLLTDAPRKDILSTINEFRKKLGSKDNLLIYYAGHGEFDKTADRAYWLPVDAQRDDPVDWISATDITDNIKRIASKHILIVSDSCYSGTLTRAAVVDLKGSEKGEYIKKMLERPSRTLMASGGNEPVADSGGGAHSVFASSFLKALREIEKGAFTAEELFHSRIKESVAGRSDQVPEYNNIKNSGHDGGDFVFMAKAYIPLNKGGEGVDSPSSEVSEELTKLREEKARLERERQELAQQKAIMEEKKRIEEEREKLEKEKIELAMGAPRKVWDAVTGKTYKDPSTAIIETKFGNIEIKFFPDAAPNHVKNFMKLAKDGVYDGTIFHRVIPGFMIQGGDPNTKGPNKAAYGMGGPGHTVKAEFNKISHKRGILSMARAQDTDSAGSQFFIVVSDSKFLDNQYTVFGEVVKGMEIADKIVNLPRNANDLPDERVEIKVKIIE